MMNDSYRQRLDTLLLNEPSPATEALFEQLCPHLTFQDVKPRTRFHFYINEQAFCYIVKSGLVTLQRDSDELVMGTLAVPMIIGMGGILSDSVDLFLETVSNAEIAVLTVPEAHKLIEELDLWETLSKHIVVMTQKLFTYTTIHTAATTYEIVRFQLIRLMQEPVGIRLNISVVKYISNRTRLSRSLILKMLSQLKTGGYIEMDNGFLTKINKLPLKY